MRTSAKKVTFIRIQCDFPRNYRSKLLENQVDGKYPFVQQVPNGLKAYL